MLHVVVWLWGSKYGPVYVDRLAVGIKRHLRVPHRFLVVSPSEEDKHLTSIPGCFARLRSFDPAWQEKHGIAAGDRIVVVDLDLIVTGSLDEQFTRDEPFIILQGVNSSNPCPYNGSVWSLRAGYRQDVWSEFTLEKAAKVPYFAFPDDQAWFAHMIPDAAAFTALDGIYAFGKPGWPKGTELPRDARLVAFPGHRDPSQFVNLPWVKKHWR